jgi:uncharacterized protein (TIGR00369 family)
MVPSTTRSCRELGSGYNTRGLLKNSTVIGARALGMTTRQGHGAEVPRGGRMDTISTQLKLLGGEVIPLRSSEDCFVCGQQNPGGLRLSFTVDPDRQTIETEWIPPGKYQSYTDVLHGGMVALLLDEAVGKLALSLGMPVVTAELTVRYLRPVPTGQRLRISARITDVKRRLLQGEAEAILEDGTAAAKATAKLMRARQ